MAVFNTGFTPGSLRETIMESPDYDQDGNLLHLVLFVAGRSVFVVDTWHVSGVVFFEVDFIQLNEDGSPSGFPPYALKVRDLKKDMEWWDDFNKTAFIHTVHTTFLQGIRKEILTRHEKNYSCLSSN